MSYRLFLYVTNVTIVSSVYFVLEDIMKTNILFVDDNPGMTRYLTRLFHNADYQVCVVNSGKEALHEIENQNFNVIITDQCMPGMKGTKLLQMAHLIQPNAIKIIFSGCNELVSDHMSLEEGIVNKILSKPCFDHELLDFIDEAASESLKAH